MLDVYTLASGAAPWQDSALVFEPERSAVGFTPYIAKGKYIGEITFDVLIADEVAKGWYDSYDNQWFPERQWCLDNLHPGDVVIDAGAHHGVMSVLFGTKVGKSGRVIAYEVLPSNAETARRNVELNGLANVEVRAVGLGERQSRLVFTDYGGNVVVGGVGNRRLNTLPIVSLDKDLGGLHVDFIKLDVEGSDLEALRGARKTIKQRPLLDLEIHNFIFKDRAAVLTEIFEIVSATDYHFAVLPTIDGQIEDVSGSIDVAWLATFENPHVFCTPKK